MHPQGAWLADVCDDCAAVDDPWYVGAAARHVDGSWWLNPAVAWYHVEWQRRVRERG